MTLSRPGIHLLARDFVKNGLLANGLIPSRIRVIILRLTGAEIGRRATIAPMCFIGSGPFALGDGSYINYQCFLDTTAGIHIATNTRLGPRVSIITASHLIGETESTRTERTPATQLNLPVVIGDNVWIGTGAIILPGVTVGNGVVIGAGTVVCADCEPNTLYAGVPARVVRKLHP
ncbi:maltose O-acetyltransferase [Mycobacterium sp. OTB74]|nr:maltose O-acetyltransferase [Mycobacterium sp. OTB74]